MFMERSPLSELTPRDIFAVSTSIVPLLVGQSLAILSIARIRKIGQLLAGQMY